jgi:MFS family permease
VTARVWPLGGLWRHPDFLRLWSAQTVSQLGTQVSQLALPLTAILVLDASAFQVAFLNTVEFLPFLLFTLPAGVWVDRLRRRPILVLADLGRALALGSVPLAHALHLLTIWQLFLVGFAVGVGTVFFDVSYQSYLPSLVERDRLVEGNSKLEVSRAGATIAGPGLAGALVGAITAPFAVLVDAVSYLGSGALIFRIRSPEAPSEPVATPSLRRELWEGLRYLVLHRYWRPIAICTALSNFFGQVGFSILLVYAVRALGLSPQLIGLSLIPLGIGSLVAATGAPRISRRIGVGPTIIAAAVLFGPASLLVPVAPKSGPIPFLTASFALLGFVGILYNITGISLMQTLTPERLLGRLNASRRFIVWGTIPLGALTGGILASSIGLRPTLWVGALGSCLCFVPILLSPLRSLADMPSEPEPDPLRSFGAMQPSSPGLDA